MTNKKLFIGNISHQATEQDLQKAFEEFGEITDLVIVTDRFSGQSKGFGFVEFSTEDSAKLALGRDGFELIGRPLRVSYAKQRERGEGGGNGGGGRFGGGGHGGGHKGGGERRFGGNRDGGHGGGRFRDDRGRGA